MNSISSMTGYANLKVQTELGEINIDIRSVNSRFLDFNYRCGEELRLLEPKVREATAALISRGKVEIRLYRNEDEGKISPAIDETALKNVLAMQEQVLQLCPRASQLSVSSLLSFPGILRNPAPDQNKFEEVVLSAVQACLKNLVEARVREGEALKKVLLKYCDQIDALVNELIPKIPLILKYQQDKLTERLEEALVQTLSDSYQISKEEINDRIRQEITLFGIRIDINEEIERLLTHVREVRRILDKGGACGRRLDFLMQELNREANTLGSKASSIDMTQTSVNLKLVIESMREQIQNLE